MYEPVCGTVQSWYPCVTTFRYDGFWVHEVAEYALLTWVYVGPTLPVAPALLNVKVVKEYRTLGGAVVSVIFPVPVVPMYDFPLPVE